MDEAIVPADAMSIPRPLAWGSIVVRAWFTGPTVGGGGVRGGLFGKTFSRKRRIADVGTTKCRSDSLLLRC